MGLLHRNTEARELLRKSEENPPWKLSIPMQISVKNRIYSPVFFFKRKKPILSSSFNIFNGVLLLLVKEVLIAQSCLSPTCMRQHFLRCRKAWVGRPCWMSVAIDTCCLLTVNYSSLLPSLLNYSRLAFFLPPFLLQQTFLQVFLFQSLGTPSSSPKVGGPVPLRNSLSDCSIERGERRILYILAKTRLVVYKSTCIPSYS